MRSGPSRQTARALTSGFALLLHAEPRSQPPPCVARSCEPPDAQSAAPWLNVPHNARRFISNARKTDLRRKQTRNHLASDTIMRLFEIAPDAGSHEKHCRYQATVKAFFGADDEALLARAHFSKWPEFEVTPHRWSLSARSESRS